MAKSEIGYIIKTPDGDYLKHTPDGWLTYTSVPLNEASLFRSIDACNTVLEEYARSKYFPEYTILKAKRTITVNIE